MYSNCEISTCIYDFYIVVQGIQEIQVQGLQVQRIQGIQQGALLVFGYATNVVDDKTISINPDM